MYDDYKQYFFTTLGKTEGAPCPEWKQTLEDATRMNPPFGVNPPPGYVQPLNAPHHAITIMIDAGGNARGRMWLPTNLPVYDSNGNAWFTHEMQVIADDGKGGLVWAWQDKGGAPVRPYTGEAVVPPTPVQPPNDYVTKDECAQMIRQALVGYIETDHDVSLATKPWDDKPGMQVCGDKDKEDTPLLANRSEGAVGAFETFTIRQA
jgi:hypothetical protein